MDAKTKHLCLWLMVGMMIVVRWAVYIHDQPPAPAPLWPPPRDVGLIAIDLLLWGATGLHLSRLTQREADDDAG